VLKLGILIINSKKLEYCSYSQNFLEYPTQPAVVLLCEIIANCQNFDMADNIDSYLYCI